MSYIIGFTLDPTKNPTDYSKVQDYSNFPLSNERKSSTKVSKSFGIS